MFPHAPRLNNRSYDWYRKRAAGLLLQRRNAVFFNFRGRGSQGKEMPPRIEGNPRASWTQDRIADERNEKADESEVVDPPGSILARFGDVVP